MDTLYPEKTDGKPIRLNDQIRLEDGTAVTVREFLQMPGVGGGLTFGQISLDNLEFVTPRAGPLEMFTRSLVLVSFTVRRSPPEILQW